MGVQKSKLFSLKSLEFNVECFRSLIDSSVEILIIIRKFIIFIFFNPLCNLVLNFKLLFVRFILSFGFSGLENDLSSLQAQSQALTVGCTVKSQYSCLHFLLISHFVWVRFKHLYVMVKRCCDISWALGYEFNICDILFVITTLKQRFSCSDIPDWYFVTSSDYEV